MNAEDALLAREEKPRKRERLEDTRQDQGRKKPRTGDRRDERRPKPLGGRFTNFTPLNAPLDQVLMQIKDEGTLTFPGKLKSDPTKRLRNKYFRLNFKNCKKKKKTFKTLQVLKGNIGHLFEAFRGTFVTLEVYGCFGYFLASMVYFSHFGWSDCVNGVNQSFPVGRYNNTCPSCN